MTDFAVVFGVRYWSAPADEEHPYGHGKIEALVTLFIAIALFVALVSVALKEWLFRWTRRVARNPAVILV